MMAARLKTLLFVLLMSFSVYAAAPAERGMNERVCPMKCCKKAKAEKRNTRDPKYLCRVLTCSQTVPTNAPAFSVSGIAPVYVQSQETDPFPAALRISHRFLAGHTFAPNAPSAGFQPIYIQINSFLI